MKNDSFMSFQRRPTRSSKAIEMDIDGIGRFNTMNSTNQQPNSLQNYRKLIQSLQKNLKQQKQKRQQAQQKLSKYQKRTIQRQKQFHKILSNLDINVTKHFCQDQNINSLYTKIQTKFQQNSQKIRQNLQIRYKENVNIMQRKLTQIMMKMQEQLKKNQKLTEQQYTELRTQINRLESVALHVDLKNAQLSKDKENLQFKVKVLSEEKQLLIQQLNSKKIIAKKYYQQAKELNLKIMERSQSKNNGYESPRQKDSARSKTSLMTIKGNNNSIKNAGGDNFAYEFVKSKISPTVSKEFTPFLASSKITSLKNNYKTNSINMNIDNTLSTKKQYISSMTLTSVSPNHKRPNTTQQSSRLVNFSNSKQTSNSKQFLQANSINSLKQILFRQRRKKLQYQTQLTDIQQKIIFIDKIVVDALVKIEQFFKLILDQQNIENGQINSQYNKRNKQHLDWMKIVLDSIKNVISGNSNLMNTIVSTQRGGFATNQEYGAEDLLKLLESREDNQRINNQE